MRSPSALHRLVPALCLLALMAQPAGVLDCQGARAAMPCCPDGAPCRDAVQAASCCQAPVQETAQDVPALLTHITRVDDRAEVALAVAPESAFERRPGEPARHWRKSPPDPHGALPLFLLHAAILC